MVAFVMKRLKFFNNNNVSLVTTGTTGKKITHAGIDKVEANRMIADCDHARARRLQRYILKLQYLGPTGFMYSYRLDHGYFSLVSEFLGYT